MADQEDLVDGEISDELKNDKHNWGAADLEKVSAMATLKEDEEKGDEILGGLEWVIEAPKEKKATIKLRKEDIQMFIDELLVTRHVAERELMNANGDLKLAMRSFTGF